jgi:hypothetical protein
MVACRVFGHRYRFTSDGATMRWTCQRGCGAGGEKEYVTSADAARYATAFDREDRDSIYRGRAMLSVLPLRLFHRLRHRGDRK